jgi:alpha-amylase/alpha-mannosidase (GH57 family)
LADRFICIHGHFYQPPRENPWLEEVEYQESAQPYHDWNERITSECYAPNAVSRVMDSKWRIMGLINNYSRISFNFGPTLLYWLSSHKPSIYQSIINADKESMTHFSGHGSAIAQVYNHMIMPLANRRDKETQVKWGIRDFQARFRRDPEGMWLPETAVDTETLEVLAENKIKFTILSPHQAVKMRKIGSEEWHDVSGVKIDPRRVYLCKLPSGKSISLFFYDKQTASDIAFGNLLQNGEAFAKRLVDSFKDAPDDATLENVASDGELYGHHHPHGDMTLAYCIYHLVIGEKVKLTNFGEYLSNHPPQYEVKIQENTSWSCIHGIERWRSDCGDNMGVFPWRQAWRKPLREAMDWLRNSLVAPFEEESSRYLKDPWAARNDYIEVLLDRSKENVERFFSKHQKKYLTQEEKARVTKMLEMQRHAMLMFTSCGWFFDEISGIEAVQVMMYAARAMQLAKVVFGLDFEGQYVKFLESAPSNIPEFCNGAKVYRLFIEPAVVDFAKMSAQSTIMGLFPHRMKSQAFSYSLPCFKVANSNIEKRDDGKFRAIVNHTTVYSSITLDKEYFGCAAFWLGAHNVSCGVTRDMNEQTFRAMRDEVMQFFEGGRISELMAVLPKYFGRTYSIKDMFKDDQRHILDFIVADGLTKAEELYTMIFQDNSAMLRFMKENYIPSPKQLLLSAEMVLNMEIEQVLSAKTPDLKKLHELINDSNLLAVKLDSELLGFKATQVINEKFIKLQKKPQNVEQIRWISRLLKVISNSPMRINLWQAQNIAFKIAETYYEKVRVKKDPVSLAWVLAFIQLCDLMGIRIG